MHKWREQLYGLMEKAGYRRRPALRRSTKDNYLFATDYPQVSEECEVFAFLEAAQKEGWSTVYESGWIELTREADFDSAADQPVFGSPEGACCLSLLLRHKESRSTSDGSAERMLAKALEEGYDAYEAACKKLHAAWASSLRKHDPIPNVDRRYFGGENT